MERDSYFWVMTGKLFILLCFLINLLSSNISGFGAFSENRGQLLGSDGQAVPMVLFYTIQGERSYFITQKSIIRISHSHQCTGANSLLSQKMETLFPEENQELSIRGILELAHRLNFYLPHHPTGITGVKSYAQL